MDTRELNQRIAADYDVRPWTQPYPESTRAIIVNLLARAYGGSTALDDVLDLGCGTGALVVQGGRYASGRLVGTDISRSSCERARAALQPYGERAEVHHSDLLDLSPERLGTFDLIYCTGVLSVVPIEVRERALALIGQCLKPGGAALISYYVGLRSAVRAQVAKTLRAAAAGITDPKERTEKARRTLDQLRSALQQESEYTLGLAEALNYFHECNDKFLLAENLSGGSEALSTAELNGAFMRAGIEFATYLHYVGFKPSYSAEDRAIMADRLDLVLGCYRYAIFVKPRADWQAPEREVPVADACPVVAGAPPEAARG
jgi:SAM-dependent methyltransferase